MLGETGTARTAPWTTPVPVSNRSHRFSSVLASLLIAGLSWGGTPVARAADVLELRLDGLEIPIDLAELEAWSRAPQRPVRGEDDLRVWFSLLEPDSRGDLVELLRAPLLRDQSFGRQLLDTWTGGQMLAAVGELLTAPDGTSTTPLLQATLVELLDRRQEVSAIELLRALPLQRVSLQIDGLMRLAEQWRQQLRSQRQAMARLEQLNLPLRRSQPLAFTDRPVVVRPQRRSLVVPHRQEPLPLQIWSVGTPGRADIRLPWVLLLPGLGGDADQLGWLAAELAQQGWNAVVLQHPGSDAVALKAALDGRRPPPGAETLAIRLADVEATLAAQERGLIPVRGEGVVLMGHSLGGLTALLAAGLEPEPGLARRCRKGTGRLPVANPSRLLQCELPSVGLPQASEPPPELRGLVLYSGFGSLLWPRRGLSPLPVPVLMEGGTLDLITPPMQEQLDLFLPVGDPRSRLVLVDGGSHFSPVRMTAREEAVFELGEELVGVDPLMVQRLLLRITTEFLYGLSQPLPIVSQQRRQEKVRAFVLDGEAARRWNSQLKP